jgi:transcriptional regulator with XRE-family HTH domain
VAKPTPQRVELGRLLKRYRERAGMQQEPLQNDLGWPHGKVSRVEQGYRILAKTEVDRLAELLAVSAEEADQLRDLANPARKREAAGGLPDWAEKFVVMERSAVEILSYDPELISGMFQTEGYAAAMLAPVRTDWEEAVQARLERRQVLYRERPPQVSFVLGEAGLHRKLGGNQVLREQLEHLLELGQLPNVTMQVLPFDVGTHPALGAGFTHLRSADPADEQVYLEGLTNGTWLKTKPDTSAYAKIFGQVQSLALDDRRSATMIRARIKELG